MVTETTKTIWGRDGEELEQLLSENSTATRREDLFYNLDGPGNNILRSIIEPIPKRS